MLRDLGSTMCALVMGRVGVSFAMQELGKATSFLPGNVLFDQSG